MREYFSSYKSRCHQQADYVTPLTLSRIVGEVCIEQSELGRKFTDFGTSVLTGGADVHLVFLDLVQVADIAHSTDTHQTGNALHVFITECRNDKF